MSRAPTRAWIGGVALVCVLLLLAFGVGLYAGWNGWTTPTVPPWPEPARVVEK